MAFLKFICMVAIIMAVNAHYNYDTSFINAINDVVLVQKSNTCVILVIEDHIQFVSTEGNAPRELAKFRNVIKGKNVEIVKANFKPLDTNDVVEKLSAIGATRDNFLVYFTTGGRNINGSVTIAKKRPVGLLGNLLGTLGIDVADKGLAPSLLDLLGIGTSVTDVKTVQFPR